MVRLLLVVHCMDLYGRVLCAQDRAVTKQTLVSAHAECALVTLGKDVAVRSSMP
jgi:hypothetical protein